MYDIACIPEENIGSILPLLELLNPQINKEIINSRLEAMKKTDYTCVGVYDNEKLIAISGIWVLHKIYAGKHIEPDNVIVHPDYRNKGVGMLLLDWIHAYGKSIGCLTAEINSRVTNAGGNTFWEKMGYEIVGYHFIKSLQNEDEKLVNGCLQAIEQKK